MPRRSVARFIAFLSSAALALGCHDGGTEPRGVSGITTIAGAGATDTVQSNAVRLTVEVRDAEGRLTSGAEDVEFTVARTGAGASRVAFVCVQPSAICGDTKYASATSDSYVAVPADAHGRATATVRLGGVAGPTWIYVTVPMLRLRDSVRVEVKPGNAYAIVGAPEDTAVVPGAQFTAGGTVVDRFGNRRTDAVALTGTSAGLLASGATVTAAAFGPQELRLAAGAITRTIAVSVVPAGQIVAGRYQAGLVVMNSDGTARRTIAMPAGVQQEYPVGAPAWLGTDVLYQGTSAAVGTRLYVADAAGASRRLLPADNTVSETLPHANAAGDVFYYARDVGAASSTLRVRRASTGVSEPLTTQGAPIAASSYAVPPAGADVAFLDFVDFSNRYVFLSRGGAARAMTDQLANALSYSPDGTRIAYINAGYSALMVMNADGTGARVVATRAPAAQSYTSVDWTADGRWLLVGHPYNLPGGSLEYRAELVEVATGIVMILPSTRGLEQAAWRR